MSFLPRARFDALPIELAVARDALVPFIGERAVTLFAYAIADESDTLVTSVYFRRILVDSGEDPDRPHVTEAEQLLVDWGRSIARQPFVGGDEFATRIESAFSEPLRLLLVTFAAQLIAASVFTNIARISLDESLHAYRRTGDDRTV
jgi:hypothetical protein